MSAIVYLLAAGALTQVKIKNVGNKTAKKLAFIRMRAGSGRSARDSITRGIYSVIRETSRRPAPAARTARRHVAQRRSRGNYIM
jgi:hypothetical protein